MSRTVLITGAGGNIGTKLRAHFSSLGWTLRLLDADARGDAVIQAADLADWDDAWVTQFAGVDAVIHLAGNPSSAASWASALRFNIDLTANVYEAAAAQGVRRVVFASSNWVMAGHRPVEGVLTTNMEPYPINPYGVSKLVGERMARSMHARRGLRRSAFASATCSAVTISRERIWAGATGDRRCGCPTAIFVRRWSGRCWPRASVSPFST